MSLTNVAIVGCNGFIGQHLSRTIAADKKIKLSLFGRSPHTQLSDLGTYQSIDLTDTAALKKQFSGIDLVYYLASETIPASSWQNPLEEIEKNLVPFLIFMQTLSSLGIKKIVFLSSAGTVYGTSKEKITEESDKRPFSPYGITKLSMEHFLNYFKVKNNISFDIYRVSNVYGEGQDTSKGLGIINTFLEKIITENKISIFGDGSNTRNYIYVKDAVSLMLHSIKAPVDNSGVFNLASNDTVSINQLVNIIKAVVDVPFEISHVENRMSDNSAIDLDNEKIRSLNREFQFTSLENGIRQTFLELKKKHIKQ